MKQLGEITDARIDQGGPPPADEFTYVDISSIDNKTKRISNPKQLPAGNAPSRARQRLRDGDVLVSMTRPNLNAVALVTPELDGSIGSTGFHVLRARENVLPQWLYYGVQTRRFVGAMSDLVQGALYPAVRPKDIRAFDIVLPDLEEQRCLVAEIEKHFSRLDKAAANLLRVKTNLKNYKAAVLQSAVYGQLLGDAPSGLVLPQDWEMGTCGDVIESIEAGASFKCEERPPVDDEVGVVKVSAVTWGEFDEHESKTCLDPRRVKKSLFIKPGDFLFSRANTIELVGACVIATRVTKSLMLSDKILRFHISARLAPEWLLICLQSKSGRAEIERLATGNQESMRNIGQDRIRQIRLPIPPMSVQRRLIAEVERHLSAIRELVATVDANLMRVQALRQCVLAAAFGQAGTSLVPDLN